MLQKYINLDSQIIYIFSIRSALINSIMVLRKDYLSLDIRVGTRFMSSSQINTRPPFSINIHFAKS